MRRSAQWTDRAARSLGQQYGNVSVGGRVTGPIQFDRSFYSIAYQAGRRWSDYQTLLNTDALGLRDGRARVGLGDEAALDAGARRSADVASARFRPTG